MDTHTSSDEKALRLITAERCQDLWERVQRIPRGDGDVGLEIRGQWSGELRWARNRITLASDRRDISLRIIRVNQTGVGQVFTNQVDDVSLDAAMRAAERQLKFGLDKNGFGFNDGLNWMPPRLPYPETAIWSDATYNVTPRERGTLARKLSERAEAHKFLAAGFVQMRVGELCSYSTHLMNFGVQDVPPDDNVLGDGATRTARTGIYSRHTEAQCSMTVRHPQGAGAGWAGRSGYDWSVIDPTQIEETAFQKCLASLNPVAIEPGRYTVILEPQAVAELMLWLIRALQERSVPEKGDGPFVTGADAALQLYRTKLGLPVVDERITISQQPTDSRLGIVPAPGMGDVTWIERGVLMNLGYDRTYSLTKLTENLPVLPRRSYQMSGGTTTLDEMITTTERGIQVSRLYGVQLIDKRSLLVSAMTRDGLWLIEKGKISRAIKNMYVTESPLFVLNQIEQLGVPVPVFSPSGFGLAPAIVPTIKAKDFAFTATFDAI